MDPCKLFPFLYRMGRNPTKSDRNAIQKAWLQILGNTSNVSNTEFLRTLFPFDSIQEELGFKLLHKTVLGLNPLDLDSLLSSVSRSAVDEVDSDGRTPLWWAARTGDHPAIRSLLKAGADSSKKSHFGASPLHTAIYKNNNACTKTLISSSYTVDLRNGHGATPLHYCCYFGSDTDIVELLLCKGADINSLDTNDYTPLMLAIQGKQTSICEFLITQGADMNTLNKSGECCLHLAINHKYPTMVRSLLQYHVEYRVKTNAGETLLHYAAQFGDIVCLEILHSFNLDGINVEDKIINFSPIQTSRYVKGLTASQIAEKRPGVTPEWLTMFRKLVYGIEHPESKTLIEDMDDQVEVFEDTVEH